MKSLTHSGRLTRGLIPILLVLAFLASASVALAHPLGNFTINHYSRIEASPTLLRIRYVLDYAEIPTFQEKQNIDRDGDGTISDAERAEYLVARLPVLQSRLRLNADGRPLSLETVANSAKLEFLPGQGGLEVMRISTWFEVPLPNGTDGAAFEYTDGNYTERLGWREIVVAGGSGVTVRDSTVPNHDQTNELTAYPEDLLNNPLNVSTAGFVLITGGAVGGASEPNTVTVSNPITTGALGAFDRTRDEFSKLITTQGELTPPILLVSFLAAIFLGALHSFSPGHGKAIVGAYLVGSRGTPKHALFLGLIVTATHTLGVYALGLVTLFLSAFILPEQLFPWLGFISGSLVAVIGIQLFIQRVRAARDGNLTHLHAFTQSHSNATAHVHEHAHEVAAGPSHDHDHSHADGHDHGDEHGHVDAHSHAQDHVHPHQEPHSHSPVAVPIGDHTHAHPHASSHTHSHVFNSEEEEREHARAHLVAVEVAEKPTWQSLVSLGVSGGLLPCPSALVVMLSAIALGRIALGLFLIIGFSLGLASVLVLTGLVLLYAGRYAGRLLRGAGGNAVLRYVPVVGAFVVALLGVGIAFESFLQTGLIK